MMQWIRSILYTVFMPVSLVLFVGPGLILYFFPYSWRYRYMALWPAFQTWLLKVLCGIRYEVEGRENMPEGNAIILAKHQSTWETFAFVKLFPRQTYVFKRELLWLPFFGWALAMLHPIAIDRGAGRKAVEQLISRGRERLKEGLWVIVFPEGTRMATHTRGKYKLGGAILAAETGYPVVPVAHNAGSFWPRKQVYKQPGTVRVCIGPVIHSEGRKADEIMADVEQWIETRMQELEGRDQPAELVIREYKKKSR
ncbi:MAG: 1-acyl-sn-glycerol-3-phosphate acyltransferase [Gammaproteobacteria bacterium]|nr:1-acyl-sn-glycerol-3-phosphate acyltransferase [Gammaproteobacteria bacterium]